MVVVLVGAVFVGSIEQVWCGALPHAASGDARVTRYDERATAVQLDKGQEMGRFNMGSTVIFALANPGMKWQPDMVAGRAMKMGECMASLEPAP